MKLLMHICCAPCANMPIDALRADGYKAIYLAVGASKGTPAGCPGDDLKGVFTGVEFLRAVNLGKRPTIGKQVAVIGDGEAGLPAERLIKQPPRQIQVCRGDAHAQIQAADR